MELTAKERILNAITGKEVDRMPWCPFLAYYWEHLPKEITDKGQFAYLQEIGADPLLRGFYSITSPEYNGCTVSEKRDGRKQFVTYSTPVGELHVTYTSSEQGNTSFVTEHPVKCEEDFKILQYLFEHMSLTEHIHEFEESYAAAGEDGLHLPVISVIGKTAFQSLVEFWCGTENLIYALCDYPETVEECLAVMREKNGESAEIAVKTSAEGFIFWEDSSTTNISPDMFRKYTKPEIDAWGDLVHRSGKLLVHHACGHVHDLIDLISEEKVDALESLSPPPTGNISLFEARERLNDRIAIIGGIEPVFLLDSTMKELESHVEGILREMKGKRYVLANSDSCPPFVEEEKFRMISRMVRR